MLRHARHVLACITAVGLLACGVDSPTASAGTATDDPLYASGDLGPTGLGIYGIERDMRTCVSPKCGGYWVYLLNNKETPCPDGTVGPRCYVAAIEWTGTTLPADQIPEVLAAANLRRLVLGGHLELRPYPPFGKLAVLVASFAWVAATDQAPSGTYYRTEDLGFVCFAYPCFNIRAYVVNTLLSTDISGLDLTAVKATPEQLAAAARALDAGTLLVPGEIKPDVLPTTASLKAGLTLYATQFYLPVVPKPPVLLDTGAP